MQVIEIPYTPREQFLPFHYRTQRWACMVVHRRGGKTVATINDIVRRAITDGKPDGRYAYIAPFYSQAKMVAWDYLLRYTAPIRVSANVTELSVDLINKSRVRLFGADNPDALRGIYLDGVALDEIADMKPRIWGEIIRPLLTDRKGWATFIGTPKGRNEFYTIWKAAQNDPAWYSLMMRASESGLIPAEELADVRKQISEDQFEQEFECSFDAANMGAVLGRWMGNAAKAGRLLDSGVFDPEGAPVYISSDIGFRDTAAWWFWQPRYDGFGVVNYVGDTGMDADEWIVRLQEIIVENRYKLGKLWLPHDAVNKAFTSKRSPLERFADAFGWDHVDIVPKGPVLNRINAARRIIERCWFDQTKCDGGMEGLSAWSYKYDEETKAFGKEPQHDWASHPGDAFSYGAQMMEERQPEKKDEPAKWPLDMTINELIERQQRRMRELEY